MPRPALKYFGLGPAWMALLGATKRMPSAAATSPPPQICAMGSAFCAATIRELAPAIVSGRMKFWLTQDSRFRLSAGWSVRTRGSNLQADVAGLCDQPTAQAGREILDAGMAFADMGEGVGETGARGS